MNIRSTIAIFLMLGLVSAPVVAQEEKDQLEVLHQSMLNLIKQLTKKGVLTQEAADKLILDAEESAAGSVAAQSAVPAVAAQSAVPATNVPVVEPAMPGVVRVPYIPESVRAEMKEEIKQEVLAQARGERWGDPGALPGWLSRISWDGDFRLRYQHDGFPTGNVTPAQYNPAGNPNGGLTLIPNTTESHDYTRVLARLGMKAIVSDNTIVVLRMGTGNANGVSTGNQTMGSDFNNYTMLLNRAFVQSAPYSWLDINAGKMPNPWLGTDMLWDGNINFEGVAAKIKPRISNELSGFLTVGAFPYQSVQGSDTNLANTKWLFGTQMSAAWMEQDSSSARFGVALYDFQNVEGTSNTTLGSHFYDQTAVQNMQKGNSLMQVSAVGEQTTIYGLASKFKELNITTKLDSAAFDPIHVLFTGDYVRNVGFNQQEIFQRTGRIIQPRINGYQAILTVGVPSIKQRGEWQASVAYKYLESDAVLDALNDQDFHLGGTNAKGFVIGGSYGVDNNTWLTLRWISSNQIDGPPLAIDSLQFDLNTRF